jgi:hypothetical protein
MALLKRDPEGQAINLRARMQEITPYVSAPPDGGRITLNYQRR